MGKTRNPVAGNAWKYNRAEAIGPTRRDLLDRAYARDEYYDRFDDDDDEDYV